MRINKLFKKYFILCLLFIFLLTLCNVYAGDVNNNDTFIEESDDDFLDVDDSYQISEYENEDLLTKTYSLNGGKFSDIQKIVDKAKNGDTIKLTGSFKSNGKQITIDKKLTITSSKGATLDGNGKSRIFNVKSNAKGLVISNIIFKNALTTSIGGGIYLNAHNVVIDKCTFQNCVARSGGAIAVPDYKGDNLIIKNSKFYSNHGSSFAGAVIYMSKNLEITSCIFDSNYIELQQSMGGGSALQIGLENEDNNCKITQCTFNNNYITPFNDNNGHAGVACLRRGVTFDNCIFTNNLAYNYGVLGFHDGGTVNNCKFYNNHAMENGGAIGFDYSNQKTIVSNSYFENNTAKRGGAIYFNSQAEINNCQFVNNIATDGGAISITNCNNVKITQSKFTNNSATNYAGALWIDNSKVIINHTNFSYNHAINGSAIYNTGELKIYSSNFNDNCAKSYKLLSKNTHITQGGTVEIKAYLEYGDNLPGIYTKNTVKIDNAIPTFTSGANNQIIILTISNTKYESKTNSKGIAVFKIKTDTLNPNTYTFTLTHENSTISTHIINQYALKVIKKISTKIIKEQKKKKTKVKKKNNKLHKKTNKKKIIKNKKINKKKPITNKKRKYKIFKSFKKKSKILLNKNLKFKLPKNNKKGLLFGYNEIKKILDFPVFQIPNYKKTLKSWGLAGNVVGFLADFILGINSEGKLTVGNLALNLLSLACGVGFYIRGGKILVKSLKFIKNSKYLQKITKIIKSNKYVKKTTKFLQNIGKAIKNNKHVKRGINYIRDKSRDFLYTVHKLGSKSKKYWNKFNGLVSKASDVVGFISNPTKKIVSKIFNYGIKKYTNIQRKIKKSNNASKAAKIKAYKNSLKANSVKKYFSNRGRTLYGLIFPNTNSIKKNIEKAKKLYHKASTNFHKRSNYQKPLSKRINKKNIAKAYHKYISKSFYNPKRKVYHKPVYRQPTKRPSNKQTVLNKISSNVNKFKNKLRSGFNRVKNFLRIK